MPTYEENIELARSVKDWAENELRNVKKEKAKLELIMQREGKYDEMDALIAQASEEQQENA